MMRCECLFPLALRPARNAITWNVLPRPVRLRFDQPHITYSSVEDNDPPISSARIQLSSLSYINDSQLIPTV